MLFIAELGLNHNGNFDLVCELMRQAKLTGADIVKLQLGWRCKEGEMNRIDEAAMDKFFKYADYLGIELMFSIINEEAFELIKKYPVKRYKVASRTVKDNLDMVQRIVLEGKETIISLGMWDSPVEPIIATNVKYLWCKSKYPAYPWDMTDMPKNFKGSIYAGYSDHTLGIEAALMAITRGAEIIEKHFTLDKSDTTIRDHTLSATPEEFKQMVNLGRAINRYIKAGV